MAAAGSSDDRRASHHSRLHENSLAFGRLHSKAESMVAFSARRDAVSMTNGVGENTEQNRRVRGKTSRPHPIFGKL